MNLSTDLGNLSRLSRVRYALISLLGGALAFAAIVITLGMLVPLLIVRGPDGLPDAPGDGGGVFLAFFLFAVMTGGLGFLVVAALIHKRLLDGRTSLSEPAQLNGSSNYRIERP